MESTLASIAGCYVGCGLVGTAILGQIFARVGWPACIGGIALSLGLAALFTLWLKITPEH